MSSAVNATSALTDSAPFAPASAETATTKAPIISASTPSEPAAERIFGIHSRRHGPAVDRAIAKTCELLSQAHIKTVTLPEILQGSPAEALLSFGGDGSLLHAARLTAPLNIPVLGVNFGHVGYMCAVKEEGLELALDRLIRRRYILEERTMLSCSVCHDGEQLWQADALNEFLIGGCNRTVMLDIRINGETFGSIRGDGLILATKTGSTAYSFSAGGPVLMLDALVMVASNAVFSSAIRSVVLPTDCVIELVNRTRSVRPFVVADGQKDCPIEFGTQITIVKSPRRSRFIDLQLNSPVETLHRSFRELMVCELEHDHNT